MKEFTQNNSTLYGSVYVVKFKDNPTPYVFGSVSAIFDYFTPVEVGITVKKLYESPVRIGECTETAIARIFKCFVLRKSQKK